jgi:DNA-binding MarR family transcriptional regulator
MLQEVPRVQRYATRPTLDELFTEEKLGDRNLKDETIYSAYVHYGYTLKEIAKYLEVHYVTISRAINRVEERNGKK